MSPSTPASLRIVADLPSADPGFGFGEYVDALAASVRGGQPPQFTVGLYGPWGSGKSSLLLGLARRLSKAPEMVPVLFDAWRYERTDHIILPLLHAISLEVAQTKDASLAAAVSRVLEAVVSSIHIRLGPATVAVGEVRERLAPDLPTLDAALSRPFHEMRALSAELGDRRIVVLVDDLDRCSPAHVVSLLEAINLVMDVRGMIFVLALDYDILVSAIEQRYPHASGHRFIEKMVQLPFRVPPLDLSHRDLRALVPSLADLGVKGVTVSDDVVVDIAQLALEGNPRQVKRLVNSYAFAKHVLHQRGGAVDDKVLPAIIALQLRWPADYRRLQEAVMLDIDEPLSVLKEEPNERLGRYIEGHLTHIEADELKEIFALTAAVVGEAGPTDADMTPADKRAAVQSAFRDLLEQRGFVSPSSRGEICYSEEHPDMRFVFVADRVRFEKRAGGLWRRWESYQLMKQARLALRVIDQPDTHFTDVL